MSNTSKTPRYQFNPNLDRDVYLQLKKLEEKTGLRPKDLIRKLVDFYLSKNEQADSTAIEPPYSEL
jgi:hypothetical protein